MHDCITILYIYTYIDTYISCYYFIKIELSNAAFDIEIIVNVNKVLRSKIWCNQKQIKASRLWT